MKRFIISVSALFFLAACETKGELDSNNRYGYTFLSCGDTVNSFISHTIPYFSMENGVEADNQAWGGETLIQKMPLSGQLAVSGDRLDQESEYRYTFVSCNDTLREFTTRTKPVFDMNKGLLVDAYTWTGAYLIERTRVQGSEQFKNDPLHTYNYSFISCGNRPVRSFSSRIEPEFRTNEGVKVGGVLWSGETLISVRRNDGGTVQFARDADSNNQYLYTLVSCGDTIASLRSAWKPRHHSDRGLMIDSLMWTGDALVERIPTRKERPPAEDADGIYNVTFLSCGDTVRSLTTRVKPEVDLEAGIKVGYLTWNGLALIEKSSPTGERINFGKEGDRNQMYRYRFYSCNRVIKEFDSHNKPRASSNWGFVVDNYLWNGEVTIETLPGKRQ